MASVKAVLGETLGRFIFRAATVARVAEVGPAFRRIWLEGEGLRGADWQPGDKARVFLGDAGLRTYTPISWDAARGATELLVYLHSRTPGADWARGLRGGESVQLFGPHRSLSLQDGPLVLFGDETSFAVAQSLRENRPRGQVRTVFEVSRKAECAPALEALGLLGDEVERAPGDAHLDEVIGRLRELLRGDRARLVLTGKAQTLQTVRARLKSERIPFSPAVRAYWSVGKRGLD